MLAETAREAALRERALLAAIEERDAFTIPGSILGNAADKEIAEMEEAADFTYSVLTVLLAHGPPVRDEDVAPLLTLVSPSKRHRGALRLIRERRLAARESAHTAQLGDRG